MWTGEIVIVIYIYIYICFIYIYILFFSSNISYFIDHLIHLSFFPICVIHTLIYSSICYHS
jgi:hypothetical protein